MSVGDASANVLVFIRSLDKMSLYLINYLESDFTYHDSFLGIQKYRKA
jgi:hypothetical protein